MTVKQNYCEVETWPISDLVSASQQDTEGKRRITIPQFQRRLVWNTEKQEKLIASIKQGYPIGSILLYEDMPLGTSNENAKRNYQLIDGLQRTQALRRYVHEPTKFFSRDEVPSEVILAINLALSNYSLNEEAITNLIVNWVRNLKGFAETDGWGVEGLLRAITNVFDYDPDSDTYMRTYFAISQNGLLKTELAKFLREVREAADISKMLLPVIIFNGPASELPTVFELLNSQGTVLSRYEIFAAQWIDQKQKIKNENIINAIWRKYDVLEDEGYTLDISEEASDTRARKQREYTLFEYLFGLGQYLSEKYPQLFRSVSEDRPSSIGFNLVTACMGLHVKDMDKLPNKLKPINRDQFEEKLLESTDFVLHVLKPILSVKQQNGVLSIYHSEYQIISMIASAFHVRYDIRANLADVDGWRAQRAILEHNLPMFYLFDYLRDYWRGSGDTKLHETVSRFRYIANPPTRQYWDNVIEQWFFDKQASLQHNRRYVRDATPEILLLKYIYVHKLTVAENAHRYHIEHVIPVDQLTKLMSLDEKWPINAVSNLALLRAKDNIRKGNKTYKQYWDAALESGSIDEHEHKQVLEDMANHLICPLEMLPPTLSKKTFEDFLLQRLEKLKQAFFEAWQDRIPVEQGLDQTGSHEVL